MSPGSMPVVGPRAKLRAYILANTAPANPA